jgi:hypothetical protein
VKKCSHCGQENDDAVPHCVCGHELVAETPAVASTGAEASPPAAEPVKEPRLVLRKVLFVVGTLALVAAYGLVRHRLKTEPLYSSLIVTGVWCATAVAGLWFLGREKRPMLRAWRIAFLVIATCMLPVILNIVDGLAEFGWPQGRFNRPIATILTFFIPLVASAFLTGLLVQIRTYRVVGMVAMLTGAASIVLGVKLIPATKSLMPLSITLGDVLNNVMFGAKLERYAAIPMGVVFIVGGLLTLLAARTRSQT